MGRIVMGARETGQYVPTASGKRFYPGDPTPDAFDIFDLASGLSNQCRFNGQCANFYSVAEHSVLVSRAIEDRLRRAQYGEEFITELSFEGLWHDGTEAMLPDMTRPVKRLLPQFEEIEAKLWAVMAPWLGVSVKMSPLVKEYDDRVLMTEAHVLCREPAEPWGIKAEPANVVIRCLPPAQARAEFLSRHFELARKRGYRSPFYQKA